MLCGQQDENLFPGIETGFVRFNLTSPEAELPVLWHRGPQCLTVRPIPLQKRELATGCQLSFCKSACSFYSGNTRQFISTSMHAMDAAVGACRRIPYLIGESGVDAASAGISLGLNPGQADIVLPQVIVLQHLCEQRRI